MRFSSASGQAAKTKVSLVRLSVKVKVRHWMLRKLLAYRAWISDCQQLAIHEHNSLGGHLPPIPKRFDQSASVIGAPKSSVSGIFYLLVMEKIDYDLKVIKK